MLILLKPIKHILKFHDPHTTFHDNSSLCIKVIGEGGVGKDICRPKWCRRKPIRSDKPRKTRKRVIAREGNEIVMPPLACRHPDTRSDKVHRSFQKDGGQTRFIFEHGSHFRGICMYYV
jgi:hypothetical protein